MLARKLLRHEADKLIEHLCKLEGDDRRLRFGVSISDEAIGNYVTKSMLDEDSAWFVCGEQEIVAACHVAIYNNEGELGCSVDPSFRGLGLAQQLFDRAVIYLRAHNIVDVYMHCLTENQIMKHIAKKNDMTVVSCDGEADAKIKVDPPTAATYYQDVYLDRIALYDMIVKTQVNAYNSFIETFRNGKRNSITRSSS